jgi:hypothetical protein
MMLGEGRVVPAGATLMYLPPPASPTVDKPS